MARRRHIVKASVQIFNLSKAGTSLELEIFERKPKNKRRKFGTVIIGRGSLTWKRRKGHLGKRISWTRFAEMMEN